MGSSIVIGSAPTGADFTLGGIARVDAHVDLGSDICRNRGRSMFWEV